jgi:hypothetical protein
MLSPVRHFAVVAELADALDSGSSGVTPVEVRLLSAALSTNAPATGRSGVVLSARCRKDYNLRGYLTRPA